MKTIRSDVEWVALELHKREVNRKMVRQAILCAMALSVMGIGAPQTAPPSQSVEPSFSVSIHPVQSIVKAGLPVEIEIEFTNTSSATIGYRHIAGRLPYMVDVRDAAGNRAPLTDRGRGVELEQADGGVTNGTMWAKVKPGQIIEDSCVVSDLYDMSKTGDYLIQVRRGNAYPVHVIVKSNTVTVTVTP
jgi:hypothetical protein